MAEDKDKGAEGEPERTPAEGADQDDDDAPLPGNADDLDPELLRLPRPRTRIGPLLAASVVVFCAYMLLTLRHDLAFSRAGEAPTPVASPQALLEGAAGADDFIALPAVPDRAFVSRVGSSEAEDGHRLAPARGTAGRLWLMLPGSVWASEHAYDEVHIGRLRPLDDVPFGDALRGWVREQPPAPRFVTGAALREAAAGNADTITTATGDPIDLRPDTPVELRVERSDRTEVHTPLTVQHQDEAAWRAALATAGIPLAPGVRAAGDPVEPEGDEPAEPDALVFTATAGADEVRAALASARLLEAWAEPVVEHLQTSFGALSVTGAGFDVGGRTVAAAEVDWAAVTAARAIPGDAVVLITDERPDTYWYILPLYIVLALFAVLFSWGLVRSLRQEPETVP
jgi:hypothetical protein